MHRPARAAERPVALPQPRQEEECVNQIRPNNLLAMLKQSEEPMLFKHLHQFDGERHTILQRAGLPTEHVYFPLSGMISFLTVMCDGEAIETSAVGYDNGAGFNTALSGRNSNCQLIVQMAMRSLRIDKHAFCRAYGDSGAVRHMVH